MNKDYEEERPRVRRSRKKPSMQTRAGKEEGNSGSYEIDAMDRFYFSEEEDPETSVDVNEIRERMHRGYQSEQACGASRPAEPKKTGRRIVTVAIMILVECLTLFGIFSYALVARRLSLVQQEPFEVINVTNEELTIDDLTKMEGYWMIAVFGVDSRGTNVGKGTNADVNMICCINQYTGEIKLVSVFRDSYLNISDKNTYNKINAAYAQGGPEQAVKALNKNLDLNITDYITFNWKAVADAVNILGGVEIEVNRSEFRFINGFITETVKSTGVGSNHLKSAGTHNLDGVQAVAYGRLRLMDNDFARTERQRKVIEKAFEKAKKADYTVLNNILVVVLPQVATSLDFEDLTKVALNVTKYHLGETSGFPMARGDANMGSKGACVIPQTLESNVVNLHKFLFEDEDYVTTETVKTISAKIAADSGMYKAGKPAGHVSTEGYIPKETTASGTKPSTEWEETKETDENGDVIDPTDDSGESSGYPSIGETDEEGNLVDPEETDLFPTESSRRPLPGQPTESSSIRPSGTDESESSTWATRPSSPGESGTTEATKPTLPSGSNSTEMNGPGVETEQSKPSAPGESASAPPRATIDDSDREIGGSTVITIPPPEGSAPTGDTQGAGPSPGM